MRTLGGLLAVGLSLGLASPAGAVELSAVAGSAADGFDQPTHVVSDPADPDRLFVAEKPGRVIEVEHGVRTPYLEFPPGVVLAADDNELGLFSIALAPDFTATGRLYALYTRDGPGDEAADLQLDEFFAAGDSVDWATRRPVVTIPVPHDPVSVHNGGQLQFGSDGLLYISIGDGDNTGQGDIAGNAQSPNSLLGKVLRIDPAGELPGEYSTPPGNPFAGPTPGADEIWSLGLRNPWRFSFDRLTGDLLIGDVGQASWEEIDFDPAPRAGRAVNFGWDCREATHPWAAPATGCEAEFIDPIHEFAHVPDGFTSVTGGFVVRDPALCSLYGRYLYAELFSGEIRSLTPELPTAADDSPTGLRVDWPVSFGEDAAGRIYVVSLTGGVYRLAPTPGDCAPHPVPVCDGRPATLVGSGALRGTPAPDVIVVGAGADRVVARGGADLICAKGGADRLRGGGGRDRLFGGHGDDRCRGGAGRDRVRSC